MALSHLVADAGYPIALGGSARPRYVLWPAVPASPPTIGGLVESVSVYGERHGAVLFSAEGAVYPPFESALVTGAVARWTVDGAPGRSMREKRRSGPGEIGSVPAATSPRSGRAR